MSMRAIVKSCLSADTLILRSRSTSGQPPKERTLHLAGLDAPRTGTRDRPDEPWAFEAREYTRLLLVGKEVAFSIAYMVPSGGEFGLVHLLPTPGSGTSPLDVALEVLRHGWSKLREREGPRNGAGEGGEDGPVAERRRELKEAEEEAKREKRGMWGGEVEHPSVNYSMPADAVAFFAEHKGKPIDAIVESVSNGTTLRARLLLTPTMHQLVTLTLAGVRAPRARSYATNSTTDVPLDPTGGAEEHGDEARFFTESRLLQRNVTVRLLSLPTPQGGNLANSQQATPGSLVALVMHPAGSISALLLGNGLAKVVDWHAGVLSSVPASEGGGMERLRIAEKEGKIGKKGMWRNVALPMAVSGAGGGAAGWKKYEGMVTRVWGGDSISVRTLGASGNGVEKRVQLSSIRMPRGNETKLAGILVEARELLRKRLIGKTVSLTVDYIRPAEGNFEQRECVTMRTQNGLNVAEVLVERGLAGVLRHRSGEDRAADYDQLMAAETKAQGESKGMHSGKEFPPPKITDVSESSTRANSFLAQFKRQNRFPCVVDFVASGSRFKIYIPKQDLKFTLVLMGIRCPRTARNPGEKNEPLGTEAWEFVNRIAMQRDAEVEVETTDKSGGFIGSLFLNKTDNVAVLLAREGLASFNEYSAERSPFAKALRDAEAAAKKERKNIWRDYDEEAEAVEAAATGVNGSALVVVNTEYQDIIVSDVRSQPFSFAVQILKGGSIPELSKLMEDFSLFHSAPPSAAPPAFRSGDLVSARFTADDTWYRAKVRRSNPTKKEAEVLFIDYGNSEVLPYSRLRALDSRFRSLPPQAKEARLSFINLLPLDHEYGGDAIERFRSLAEGRTLVCNVDYREPGVNGLLHLSLYEPSSAPDATSSINTALIREGYARIDTKARYRSVYPAHCKALERAKEDARQSRAGAYEFGDALDDD